ncbi:hypothetical protein [Streptomyces sp. NPDC060194]|uniref:hypothetical protein n=1 Tax=Streptomyces sp. NPDC060194 TaxID=3347069 RepID=UPI003668F80F
MKEVERAMSIGAIITLVVIAVIVIAAIGFVAKKRSGGAGGGSLKRRFGPEYDRTLERHHGDKAATERELKELVDRHGHIEPKPLSAETRENYVGRWAVVQERFVESPQQAAAEADALLSELAQDRGYGDSKQPNEQIAALSVHHAHHVHGYRRMHTGLAGMTNTEELRHAMLEARELFDELVTATPADKQTHHDTRAVEGGDTGHARGNHLPGAFQKKGEAR